MSGGTIGSTLGTAAALALAPETGGLSLGALALPALGGAAGGALGSYVTGDSKNMWKNALLGGLGGAAGGGLNAWSGNASGLGGLFNSSGNAASGAADAAATYGPSELPWLSQASVDPGIAQAVNAAGDSVAMNSPDAASFGIPTANGSLSIPFGSANSAASAAKAADSAPQSIGSKLMGYAPYAGLGLGAMALDNFTKPKQVGPTPQSHPSNPGAVRPLSMTQQTVDPNSYFMPNQNRSYFSGYGLQPQFMARGGAVKRFANGGSSNASSSNIPPSSLGGKLINTAIKHPAMYPVKGKNNGVFRYYADGGSADGMINGPGDGQSDSIPAQLSDGEFVMSAPVVSALGNGSNKAGAKKLASVQKNVLKKHYSGGKPHKAMGLASYVH